MANVTFQGQAVSLAGIFPKAGQQAPDFKLTDAELNDQSLQSYRGQKLLLNIFPSIDTPVCAASVRQFNKAASEIANCTVLCISADLPFALSRFCGAEGLDNVKVLSFFRNQSFMEKYGVAINKGPLTGLSSRAVVCINEEGLIVYSQLVAEITQEPDYDEALAAIRSN